MPVDWVDESLQFARALYALKSKSGFLEVLIECTRLLETHTHAVAAAFVRLEDALTARNVVVVPDSYKVPRFAPMELAERLKHGGLDIGPLEDGPAGPVRRVSIPVSSAGPQGLFLAYCRDETIVEEGFDRHLAFMAAGLGDCLAALQVRQDLVELNTRHRAIMENIPQGVVFIAETGRRVWLNHQGAQLLKLPGTDAEPAAVAEAMRRLKAAAWNRSSIEQTGQRLFGDPAQKVREWNWIYGDPMELALSVSSVSVREPGITGHLWVFDDITYEQQATLELLAIQEQLTESEERFRGAFENSATGMALIDTSDRFCQVNQALCDMLGYTPAELTGKTFQELTHPDDRELTRAKGEEFNASEKPEIRYTKRYLHRDGHAVWVMLGASMIRGPQGERRFAVVQVIDITQQKLAEQRVQDAADQLERMASNLSGGIFFRTVHRPDGSRRYTWISPQVEQFLGVSREDILKDHSVLDSMVVPDDVARVRASQAEAIRDKKPYDVMLRVRHADGSMRWMNMRGTPTFEADGSVTWDAFAMDMTAQEETRQALARREAMLSQLGDNLPNGAIYQGYFDADGQGKVVFASAGFEMLTGIAPADFAPECRLPVDRILPEDMPVYQAARQKALETMGPFDAEVRMKGRGDVVRWVRMRSAPFRRSDGKIGFNGILLDVSEKRAAEEATRLSEELFRGAFDGSATGILLIQPDRRFFKVNRAFCDMLGYTEAELLGKTFLDITHPEELDDSTEKARQIWSGEIERLFYEKRYVHKNGSTVWVYLNLSLIHDGPDHPMYAIAQVQDITARKNAEEALRQSEQRFRTVLEAQTELVCRSLPDGTVNYANDVFCRFFDKKHDEVVGHNWGPLIWYEDIARVTAEVRTLSPGKPVVHTTNRVYAAGGKVRWVEFVSTGQFDEAGQLREMQSVGRDVTDRVEKEKLLLETNQRLKLATEAGSIGTWSWTFSDDSLQWDKHLIEWYDVPEELRQTGPTYAFWRSRVHPDDVEEAERTLQEAKAADRPWDHSFRVLRPDGTISYIHSAAVIEHDATDKPVRFIGINRDVTREREAEDRLKAAKKEADAASLAKSEFLANMSHEVRSPLTAVLGYADMLMDPKLSPEMATQAVQAIRRNGGHLLTILNDILDLSKVEAGKIDVEIIPYSPWRLVQEVDSLLKVRAEERSIVIRSAWAGPLPALVEMDPTRVRQVLVNLVSNAVKFSEPGDTVRIRLGVKPAGKPCQAEMTIEVEDEGIGMSADQLKVIFQPFRQADSSTTRKFGGTGLGLSITHRMVEVLGGEITVTSELGRGSCFTVRLPVAIPERTCGKCWAEPAPAKPGGQEKPKPSPQVAQTFARLSGTVLLAEDSEDNRRVISFMLGRMGLKPEFAVNGQEAFQAALKQPYDLILMDMQMPVMDGYAATQALRKSGYEGKIVALTAHSMSEDRDKCLQVGCDDYLTKPIDARLLTESIARILPEAEVRNGVEADSK